MARRRRTGLTLLVGILVVLVLLWSGLWYAGSLLANQALAAMAEDDSSDIACADQAVAGFPLRFDLNCSRISFADPSTATQGTVDGIAASALLYNPGAVSVAAAGPLLLEAPELGRLQVAWQEAATDFHVGFGGLNRAAVALSGVTLSLDNAREDPGIRLLTATSGSASVAPDPDLPESLLFGLAAADVAVETTDGRSLPAVTLDAAATVEGIGTTVGGEWAERQEAWLAAGGRIHLDHFSVAAGASRVAAAGDLDVGRDGLLSGKLVFTITGFEALPTVAEAFSPGAGEDARRMLGMISGLTKPVETADGPGKTLEVTLRDGAVMVGILPLPFISLPPVF